MVKVGRTEFFHSTLSRQVGPLEVVLDVSSVSTRDSWLSSECHYPIRFPILSSVVRERLFKTTRVRLDIGETVAIKNGSSLKFFLIVEVALTADELANHGLAYDSVSAASPVQAPLTRLKVVKP